MTRDDFWSKLKQRVRDVSVMAADFTEEQALIGKLKFDILTLKRKVDRMHREIGLRVCEIAAEKSGSDIMGDNQVKTCLKEINSLEKQIELKKTDIAKVADQVRRSKTPTAKTTAGKPAEPAKTRSGKSRKTAKSSAARSRPKGSTSKKKTSSGKGRPKG